MQSEVRHLTDNLQVGENVESMAVQGYALKFNTRSEVLYTPQGKPFIEVIEAGALDNANLSDVRMFAQHDPSKLLGRTTSETLAINVDETGLYVRCDLPDNSLGRDTYESIRRKDLNQMSFHFSVDKEGQRWDFSEDIPVRYITNIRHIKEVSAVAIPAYSDTELQVATRSLEQANVQRALELVKVQIELERW